MTKYKSYNHPDGGTTSFWYNTIGQLRFSQNSKQLTDPCIVCGAYYAGRYSYTIYDGQGRIIEVGENEQNYSYKKTVGGILTLINEPFYNGANVPSFPNDNGWQVTKTYYDQALAANPVNTQFTGSAQQLLRKRVASVTIEETEDTDDNTYDHATHYSYDVHGNVAELVQENPSLASIANSYKKMQYKYDLISGNVHEVSYQKGKADQFHHRYYYDANNRIISAQTSSDYMHWQQDARYFYYLHGPLARTEIGDDKVQGLDYAYTLQGWIKNVNSNTLQNYNDPGMDSYAGYSYLTGQNNLHKNMGKDVFGYSLDYYSHDYEAIKTSLTGAITANLASSAIYAASNNLYNGNIKGMSTAMYQPNGSGLPTQMTTVAKFYTYDQLNRIQEAQTYQAPAHSFAGLGLYTTPSTSDYYEFFRYDPNGNIKKARRNGYLAAQLAMEDLTYNNATANNRLMYVTDAVLTDPYTDDITTQGGGNYGYDAIGNLISDASEKIASIEWTVYGKIKRITRTATSTKPDLEFLYDANGNRIYKLEKPRNGSGYVASNQWKYNYYVRDAQGNVMAVYDKYLTQGALNLRLTEHHLYGSSRLGIETKGIDMQGVAPSTNTYAGLKGKKYYELSNHLGNVVLTISDRKLSISAGSGGLSTGYLPEVLSATDYYVFGAPMPGRQFNSPNYRYGFNGKEKDDEVKGTGNSVDFGARIYDSRLGRWLSTDPERKKYPYESPYSFAVNSPIGVIDREGRDVIILAYVKGQEGSFAMAAITRGSEVMGSKSFDPKKDHVYVIQITAMSDLIYEVSKVVKDANDKGYGKTVEFSLWSHNGQSKGPVGVRSSVPGFNVGDEDLDGVEDQQMNSAGWGAIDFNFDSECSIANFYGCYSSGFAEQFSKYQKSKYVGGLGGSAADTEDPAVYDSDILDSFYMLWEKILHIN